MKITTFLGRKSRKREVTIEDENLARMAKAERDLADLAYRADVAIKTLDTRDRRNHWQESVTAMIQGVL